MLLYAFVSTMMWLFYLPCNCDIFIPKPWFSDMRRHIKCFFECRFFFPGNHSSRSGWEIASTLFIQVSTRVRMFHTCAVFKFLSILVVVCVFWHHAFRVLLWKNTCRSFKYILPSFFNYIFERNGMFPFSLFVCFQLQSLSVFRQKTDRSNESWFCVKRLCFFYGVAKARFKRPCVWI